MFGGGEGSASSPEKDLDGDEVNSYALAAID